MSMLVENCPRCGARKITFDVLAQVDSHTEFSWQRWYEIFCVCRQCDAPTIFLVGLDDIEHRDRFYRDGGLVEHKGALNTYFDVRRFISLRDHAQQVPPEHLPDAINDAFKEGAACLSVECFNAASTMFRLCVDLATRPLLPERNDIVEGQDTEDAGPQPNSRQRRNLGLRLEWLFENRFLPNPLRELAQCIREDGNDGAHVGNLTREDAEDLLDFTVEILERLFTEPMRIELAKERRDKRRKE